MDKLKIEEIKRPKKTNLKDILASAIMGAASLVELGKEHGTIITQSVIKNPLPPKRHK